MPVSSVRDRVLIPELMDQPDLDPAEHHRALRALARINRISDSTGLLYRPIRALARSHSGPEPLRVLDIACGGGDVTVGCAARAKAEGLPIVLEGCDMSETALSRARANADLRGVAVTFFQQNVIDDALPEGYDVVMSSLFLHHLTDDDAQRVLAESGRVARRMVLVNDLIRGLPGLLLAHFAGNVLTRSPVVRFDAPASVSGAFTTEEMRQLATRSGLAGATVHWRWPWRFLLLWTRPHDRTDTAR